MKEGRKEGRRRECTHSYLVGRVIGQQRVGVDGPVDQILVQTTRPRVAILAARAPIRVHVFMPWILDDEATDTTSDTTSGTTSGTEARA